MDGFEAGERELPGPQVDVSAETRERLIKVSAALISGWTPEEIAAMLAEPELPADALLGLDRSGEREEMSAHVDILLSVLQTPAGTHA